MSQIAGLFGEDAKEFSKALLASFNNARLKEMLFYKLQKDIEDYAGEERRSKVLEIIMESNRENYWRELVLAALESNPGSPSLVAVAETLGLTSAGPELEAKVRAANQLLEPEEWRSRMAEMEFRVCRIEVPVAGGSKFGTGFLVNAGAVLTNYHVVEPVHKGKAKSEAVVLLFDYRRSADGKTVSKGTPWGLEKDWLIDHSPYDPQDCEHDPEITDRPTDHLDYALLCIKGKPGAKKIGKKPDLNGADRGFIAVPDQIYSFAKDGPLMILQHPDAGPLKLAIETKTIMGVNKNQTRVRYDVETLGGSSGSPCFDLDWHLVALHHAGDPNSDIGLQARYNQGIPIAAIRTLMTARGTTAALGAAQ